LLIYRPAQPQYLAANALNHDRTESEFVPAPGLMGANLDEIPTRTPCWRRIVVALPFTVNLKWRAQFNGLG